MKNKYAKLDELYKKTGQKTVIVKSYLYNMIKIYIVYTMLCSNTYIFIQFSKSSLFYLSPPKGKRKRKKNTNHFNKSIYGRYYTYEMEIFFSRFFFFF